MPLLDDALVLMDRAKDSIQDFAYVNSDLVYAVGILAVGVGALVWIANRQPKSPGEGKKVNKGDYILSKRELKQQENNLIADEVENFLLKLYTDRKITEERYQHWHLRFGTQLGLKDLLPLKMTPEQMKVALAKKHRMPRTYRPVPFPKENKADKPKNALDAILSKFKS